MTTTKVLGVIVSLGLSAAFIVAGANVEAASSADGGVSNRSGTPNGDNSALATAVSHELNVRGSSIIVQTSSQNADAATDNDITTDEVGRWAAYFNEQGLQEARKACVEKRGGSVCDQITGDETHEVSRKDGRKVAIIHLRVHASVGDTAFAGRVVRVMALKGNELVSVACFRAGDEPLEPTMSPCAEEIKRSLGFTP
jgi:hypothetical protein